MGNLSPTNSTMKTIKIVTSKNIEEISKEIMSFLEKKKFKTEFVSFPTSNEAIIKIKKNITSCFLKIESPPGQEYMTKIYFLYNEDLTPVRPSIITIIRQFQTNKSKSKDNSFSSVYKLYWLMIFVLGIALTSLVSIFTWLRNELVSTLGFLGVIILILLITIFTYFGMIGPIYISNWKKRLLEKNQLEIYYLLEELTDKITNNKSEEITCWNCFERIDSSNKVCPHCGAKL